MKISMSTIPHHIAGEMVLAIEGLYDPHFIKWVRAQVDLATQPFKPDYVGKVRECETHGANEDGACLLFEWTGPKDAEVMANLCLQFSHALKDRAVELMPATSRTYEVRPWSISQPASSL